MRTLFIIFFLPYLVGCAISPPKNKQNACSLLWEKEEWLDPLKESSRKWNIPKYTILSIIYHESKFVSNAVPPRIGFFGLGLIGRRISSAYGYSQALDGTWEDYMRSTGKWYASRTDFGDSVDFIGWYLNRAVKSLGISRRNAYHLYLSYHQGINGFRKKSYVRKPAIKNYARKVQETALVYKKQIRSCS